MRVCSQRRRGNGHIGKTRRTIRVGGLHIDLDRNLLAIDDGDKVCPGGEIAIGKGLTEGDITRSLRGARAVLEAYINNVAWIMRLWQRWVGDDPVGRVGCIGDNARTARTNGGHR